MKKKTVEPQVPRTVKVLPQTGKLKNIRADIMRQAKAPGKRISKSGAEYWETRINRSDRTGRRI